MARTCIVHTQLHVLTWLQQERGSEKLITLVKDIAKDSVEVGCIKQALCQQQ